MAETLNPNESGALSTAAPQYTADDYLNSDAPYKALYAMRDNPFNMTRALEIASKAAAEVGVRNFKFLYKSYCESMVKSAAQAGTNATNYDGQLLELACGDWMCDEYGVRRGNGSFEEVACQSPVLITHRYENIDTGLEKVELSFKKGGCWRKLIIPCSQYASPKELVKLSDCGLPVNLRMAQSLSDFLMDIYSLNYERIPESKSVSRMGWINDTEFSPFVSGLVFDGSLEYKPIFDAITQHGSFDTWKTAALAFRKESLAARIVMATSFASALVKPLGGLPFFVHLWGVDSSTGKTVALMAAASVWANPEMGKYVKSFDGTDVGYERIASFLNSLPLCIDELQLAAKNSRGQNVFSVYRLSQGAGRLRGNKSGGIDTTPTWSLAMITTGETPLNSVSAGAGAVNRVIEIECTADEKVVRDGHAVVQQFRQNYGFAGREFVRRLMQPGEIERARTIYQKAFTALNSSETTDKQAMAAAIIITADHLATDWIFEDGNALTVADLAKYLAGRAEVSAGVRGYNFMCDWVTQNSTKLKPEISQGDVYGVIDGSWVYIINSVFRRVAEEAGFNAQALLSYMKSNDLIKYRGRNYTRGKRISGVLTECVCMKMKNIEEDFDYGSVDTDAYEYI